MARSIPGRRGCSSQVRERAEPIAAGILRGLCGRIDSVEGVFTEDAFQLCSGCCHGVQLCVGCCGAFQLCLGCFWGFSAPVLGAGPLRVVTAGRTPAYARAPAPALRHSVALAEPPREQAKEMIEQIPALLRPAIYIMAGFLTAVIFLYVLVGMAWVPTLAPTNSAHSKLEAA